MKCEQIQNSLVVFLLGDAGPEASNEIESHLAECASCSRALADTVQDLDAFAESLDGYELPGDELTLAKVQVQDLIRSDIRKSRFSSTNWISWTSKHSQLATFAAGLLLGLGISPSLSGPTEPTPVERPTLAESEESVLFTSLEQGGELNGLQMLFDQLRSEAHVFVFTSDRSRERQLIGLNQEGEEVELGVIRLDADGNGQAIVRVPPTITPTSIQMQDALL